jgi:hypothetical protein
MLTRISLLLVLWLAALPVFAASDGLLKSSDQAAADFEYLHDEAHLTIFQTPADWDQAFFDYVEFYGERFGDVKDIYGTVVLYGPPAGESTITGSSDQKLTVLCRKLFPLADVPEQAGWYRVTFDTMEAPAEFAVAVFTFSTEDAGVKLGLCARTTERSHSTQVSLSKMIANNIMLRTDGRDWLMRAQLKPQLAPQGEVSAAGLSGANFAFLDDGSADGFTTAQRNGPMVKFNAGSGRKIKKVHVFANVSGEWFKTERFATVYIMGTDFKLKGRAELNYSLYTNEGSWSSTSFNNVKVTKDFYVLLEPKSDPAVQLNIGYDTSSTNQGSLFGTQGGTLKWGVEAPEDTTNWMIRVEYE